MTSQQPDKRLSQPWTAHWIWDETDGKQPNRYLLFRTTFELDAVPANALLRLSADTRYQLFLNEREIGKGPPQSQPFYHYFDFFPCSQDLQPGPNVIAAIVYFAGVCSTNRGGFLLELLDNDGQVLLASGPDFRLLPGKAWQPNTFYFRWNRVAPYQEFFDSRQLDPAWNRADFDDSRWPSASVIERRFIYQHTGATLDRPPVVNPWTRLVPRDIPRMASRHLRPVSIVETGECREIINRTRPEDLSINLSAVLKPIRYTKLSDAENLLHQEGSATIFQNSRNHLDSPAFDGIFNPAIVLDFGKVINAYLEVEVEGPVGGIIDFGSSERLIDDAFNNAIEGQFADRLILRGGRQVFCTFSWHALRYLKIMVRECMEPLRIHRLEAITTDYPFREMEAFHCSSDRWNRLFDICQYTIRLCSEEALMDTPWREQSQWLGDVALVTIPGIYCCFGDTALPEKFLRQAAVSQLPTGFLTDISNLASMDYEGTHVDFSLWWIHALWNHYLYTGSEEWIHQYYPHAVKIVDAFSPYLDKDGLIRDMPYVIFIDWARLDKTGASTALNAIYYGTLEVFLKMARLKGDRHWIEKAEARRQAIQAAFAPTFWSEEQSLFADAQHRGKLSQRFSEQANMAAIRFGLVSEKAQRQAIIGRLFEQPRPDQSITEAQPFFSAVVLQALWQEERQDLAFAYLEDRWGKRMLDRGATSTHEEWGIWGSRRHGFIAFMRTLTHAWSAFPAELLTRHLAGIEILEPGCQRIRVSPYKADFSYTVRFPTPAGDVRIHWDGSQANIQAASPIAIEP